MENLVFTPNRVEGQHGVGRLKYIVDRLKQVDNFGGTKEKISDMLIQLGEESARLK